MNNPMFLPMTKIMAARRPAWKFVIEDNLVRILTSQFAVEWPIIEEIVQSDKYRLEEVIMHQALGLVICIRYIGGT